MKLPKATKELASGMKAFAERFPKEDWAILCEDKEFLIMLTDDLPGCRIYAEKVLHKAKFKK